MTQSKRVHASVVIPAHNEARSIGGCLAALRDNSADIDLEVVVVANGCTDDTASVAETCRDLPGLRVISITEASKIRALNVGDSMCRHFPRIYLDADIRLGPTTLYALVEALAAPGALMASPRGVIDTSGSSAVVRAFYDVFIHLPYTQDTTSAGVYGFSEAGRRRFDAFPDVIADDLFVQRLFSSDERQVVAGENYVIAPKDIRNLIRVRRRTARGNKQLAQASLQHGVEREGAFEPSTKQTVRSLLEMAFTRPGMLPKIGVYAGVTVAARSLAGMGSARWERDTSTR